MEEQESIHVLMSRVMSDMPAIAKNQQNSQQNYAFRGIDDVMNELKPVLVNHGVFYVPEQVVSNEHEWRQTKSGGTQHSTVLRIKYRFYGPAGDSVVAETIGESADPADKSTQQAMSQALKSLLLQTFCIGTEESARNDPDSKHPEDGGDVPTHISLMPYVRDKMTGERWEVLKAKWMETYDFSVFGVPLEREQEMRGVIDKFVTADSETGEMHPSEPNAQERSDEGAGEIDIPSYEAPMKYADALKKVTEIFKQVVQGSTKAGAEGRNLMVGLNYYDMEIGLIEWEILTETLRDRIAEIRQEQTR